jgi:hypothetical protein
MLQRPLPARSLPAQPLGFDLATVLGCNESPWVPDGHPRPWASPMGFVVLRAIGLRKVRRAPGSVVGPVFPRDVEREGFGHARRPTESRAHKSSMTGAHAGRPDESDKRLRAPTTYPVEDVGPGLRGGRPTRSRATPASQITPSDRAPSLACLRRPMPSTRCQGAQHRRSRVRAGSGPREPIGIRRRSTR